MNGTPSRNAREPARKHQIDVAWLWRICGLTRDRGRSKPSYERPFLSWERGQETNNEIFCSARNQQDTRLIIICKNYYTATITAAVKKVARTKKKHLLPTCNDGLQRTVCRATTRDAEVRWILVVNNVTAFFLVAPDGHRGPDPNLTLTFIPISIPQLAARS